LFLWTSVGFVPFSSFLVVRFSPLQSLFCDSTHARFMGFPCFTLSNISIFKFLFGYILFKLRLPSPPEIVIAVFFSTTVAPLSSPQTQTTKENQVHPSTPPTNFLSSPPRPYSIPDPYCPSSSEQTPPTLLPIGSSLLSSLVINAHCVFRPLQFKMLVQSSLGPIAGLPLFLSLLNFPSLPPNFMCGCFFFLLPYCVILFRQHNPHFFAVAFGPNTFFLYPPSSEATPR